MPPYIMDRETEVLEKEDPGFYAIDKLTTGIASIATTEKFNGQIVSFGLPSSPGLFLNLALNFKRQVDAINLENCFAQHPNPQGSWPEDHSYRCAQGVWTDQIKWTINNDNRKQNEKTAHYLCDRGINNLL